MRPVPLELAASANNVLDWTTQFELSVDGQWLAYSAQSGEVLPWDKAGNPAYSETGVPDATGPKTQVTVTNTRSGESYHLGDAKHWGWAPTWSPDGKRLAYFSDEDGEAGLWIWDTATRKATRFPKVIIRATERYEFPLWASDSRHVLCKTLPTQLTIRQANARSPQIIASAPPPDPFPKVGPNQPSVIVAESHLTKSEEHATNAGTVRTQPEEVKSSATDLSILDLVSGDIVRVATDAQVRWFAYSPDEKYVAYDVITSWQPDRWQGTYRMMLHDIRQASTKVLVDELHIFGNPIGGCTWSPKSTYVACYTSVDQQNKDLYPLSQISVISVAQGTVRAVGASIKSVCGFPYIPLWDKDEASIYAMGSDDTPGLLRDWERKIHTKVWKVDVASGAASVLSDIPNYQIAGVFFAPRNESPWSVADEHTLWIAANKQNEPGERGNSFNIYTVDTRSGATEFALQINSPRYLGFSSIHSGDVAYISSDLQNPRDIWRYNVRSRRSAQMTHLNQEWERYQLGTGRRLEYYDAEGNRLHAALLLPPDYRSGRRVPLVVFTFGWPDDSDAIQNFGLFGDTASYNMHVLATRGYAVLLPDIPLRTGEQMKSVIDSVLPAVNSAIENGYADSDRLAVIGYSIGSFTGLSLILQSHRFKAAALGGISVYPDLMASYLAGDPRVDSYPILEGNVGSEAMGGTPWSYRDRYISNSTAFYFDRLETPLLMGQGTMDGLTVSGAIFLGLKRLNKEVEYRIYEKEDHSISREPNVVDFWKRRIEFFDRHLNVIRDSEGRMLYDGTFAKSRSESVPSGRLATIQ